MMEDNRKKEIATREIFNPEIVKNNLAPKNEDALQNREESSLVEFNPQKVVTLVLPTFPIEQPPAKETEWALYKLIHGLIFVSLIGVSVFGLFQRDWKLFQSFKPQTTIVNSPPVSIPSPPSPPKKRWYYLWLY